MRGGKVGLAREEKVGEVKGGKVKGCWGGQV